MNTIEEEDNLDMKTAFKMLIEKIDTLDNRMNNIEIKMDDTKEWFKQKMIQSVQNVVETMENHIQKSDERDQEYRVSIHSAHSRITSAFSQLTNDIIANADLIEKTKKELTDKIVELSDDINSCREEEDINHNIPLIEEKVNSAVEGLLGSVQFINHNIANDVLGLNEKISALDERIKSLKHLENFQPEFFQSKVQALEENVCVIDHEQRRTARELLATGQAVHTIEGNLQHQINEVTEVMVDLQGIVADSTSQDDEPDVAPTLIKPPDKDNSINWYKESTMGNTTAMGFSLMQEQGEESKEEPQPKRKLKKKEERKTSSIKKKRKSHGDDDPDSSESGSSSSSDSENNDSDRPRKARKKDTDSDTSDDDNHPDYKKGDWTFTSSRSKGSDKGNRRASIIGDDDYSGSSSSRNDQGGRKHSNSNIIYVQPSPSVQDLKLKEVKIGPVLRFCKTFNNETSKFRGGLNAANYIDEKILCQMKQVAAKHRIAGADGILSNGRQKISNREVFAILAIMCAPTNLQKMQLELSKSCWPRRDEYKSAEEIMKNIAEFKIDLFIYIDRFEDKLTLFAFYRKSRKLIPTNIFKKGGSDPGLADYFIGGMPDKNLGARIWASVPEKKRKKCKTFAKFKKYYIEAIEEMEEREKNKEVNQQICFGVKEMVKTDESSRKTHSRMKDHRVTQRVHNAQKLNKLEEGATVVSDIESNEEVEVVFTKESEDNEELPSAIETHEDEQEEDHSEITEEDVSLLANLLQPADSRTPGICYDMLYKGKCDKSNCPYSHKAEDIEKAKKLKALRLGSLNKTPGKQVSFHKPAYTSLRKT